MRYAILIQRAENVWEEKFSAIQKPFLFIPKITFGCEFNRFQGGEKALLVFINLTAY